MRDVVRWPVSRRRLLRISGWLSQAVVAGTLWPQAYASQTTAVAGYADGDGVRLYVVRAGEGELMVFLHGAPDDWSLYANQIAEFSRDHMVVAPNLRGFAPSDQPVDAEAYAMPKLLGDIHGLLRHLGRQRCILVGNDWGGYIAWVFASAYPACVERLIILNAPHPAILLRELRNNPAQIEASQYERDYRAAVPPHPAWYNYYRADPIRVPASVSEAAHMEMPDLASRFFAGMLERPINTSLRVDVPTLVVWGMRDQVLLPGLLDGLPDYAPHATLVRIDDAGHLPMQSHPSLVNRAIREFLQRVPR